MSEESLTVQGVVIKRLKSKLAEIAELCEAEIESKGRWDAALPVLEILEVVQR
mgnify:CR=1 FL=1